MSLEETCYTYDSDDESYTDDDDVDYALADISLPKKNNVIEEYYYEILSADDIVQQMLDVVREANGYVNLPETTTRLLLNYFRWDMQKFVDTYYNGDQEQMFEKAHVINPFYKNFGVDPKPSDATEECQVCFVPSKMMTGLECGHQFCQDCWNEYLKTKIMDEGIVQTIQCAASSCDILVDDAYIMRLVKDPNVKQRYQRLISNAFVECNKLIKWCRRCEIAIMVRCVEAKPVKCKCNLTFCFGCEENWHDPVDCNLLRKWNRRNVMDLESHEWILSYARNCPQCDVPIEKNGGCNHMTCKNVGCRYEFCWLCSGHWTSHHGCNRFDIEQAEQTRLKKKEQAKDSTQLALQKYTFFNERFMNHMQSLKFENQLHSNMLEKMKQAQQEYDMTWNEVSFLLKAVEVLVSCRQTLMYTYVFAYYLEKNHQSKIFEDNQQDLENAVEVLSGYLERDVAVDNLSQMKPKVQDKYKYCDKRRMVLLEHIHEGNNNKWWVLLDI